ncbi:hypothetical protein Sme01_45740 [Sphaerisporangium melleum]|uniref:Uncharacterized protein n=1 Tax=Sphaerisporangium melleum TaxID=321316 RepID=A0A917R0M1_9ACTN|nr:hypothetical protein GCM10007964_23340 [Sphaerisporangium melleum]GII72098.1 hypothetical protein Sme01_45740 [Sphaerisporangium melleum]
MLALMTYRDYNPRSPRLRNLRTGVICPTLVAFPHSRPGGTPAVRRPGSGDVWPVRCLPPLLIPVSARAMADGAVTRRSMRCKSVPMSAPGRTPFGTDLPGAG